MRMLDEPGFSFLPCLCFSVFLRFCLRLVVVTLFPRVRCREESFVHKIAREMFSLPAERAVSNNEYAATKQVIYSVLYGQCLFFSCALFLPPLPPRSVCSPARLSMLPFRARATWHEREPGLLRGGRSAVPWVVPPLFPEVWGFCFGVFVFVLLAARAHAPNDDAKSIKRNEIHSEHQNTAARMRTRTRKPEHRST